MNFKSEKGFITEFLTISIIVMLIGLTVLLIYTFIDNNELYEDSNTTFAEEYITPSSNNRVENNTVILNETNTITNETNYKYSIEDILNNVKESNTVTENVVSGNQAIESDNYNKYYYSQLNENSKAIYDVLYNNKENMKSGQYSMQIPDSVTNILYQDNGKEKLSEAFQSAIDAIKMDNPDLFYIAFNKILLVTETTTRGNSKTYKLSLENDENNTFLSDNFSSKEAVTLAINQLENKRNEILRGAVGSDYDKIKYVHDWIVENVEYETTISKKNIHNIYGALIENEVVCGGYAKAFKYLLDELNIPCIIVQGVATNSDGVTENHAWNYVKLNGKWYGVDTTWDDPVIEGWSSILYTKNTTAYFLKGSNSLFTDHTENGAFSEGGKIFNYPTLSYLDY